MTVADQIVRELEERLTAWEALLGHDVLEPARRRIADRAAMWAAQLTQVDDDRLSAQTVIDLMAVLGDREPEWFPTPLGRLVARSAGSPLPDCVSHSVAAAMLGVSRARVGHLADAGRLDRCPDGSLSTVSVLAEMDRRAS